MLRMICECACIERSRKVARECILFDGRGAKKEPKEREERGEGAQGSSPC